MSAYKLYYFNLRGRAEVARLIFAYAGVSYEDVRIEREKWPDIKPTSPGGTVPYLEVEGRAFGQSQAINRYLARKFGLMGQDELTQFAIDEFAEDVIECRTALFTVRFETDETRKAVLEKSFLEVTMPKFLKKWEAMLADSTSGWVIGDSLTLADLALFDGLYGLFEYPKSAEVLSKMPHITAHREKVMAVSEIKAWLDKRPNTTM